MTQGAVSQIEKLSMFQNRCSIQENCILLTPRALTRLLRGCSEGLTRPSSGPKIYRSTGLERKEATAPSHN